MTTPKRTHVSRRRSRSFTLSARCHREMSHTPLRRTVENSFSRRRLTPWGKSGGCFRPASQLVQGNVDQSLSTYTHTRTVGLSPCVHLHVQMSEERPPSTPAERCPGPAQPPRPRRSCPGPGGSGVTCSLRCQPVALNRTLLLRERLASGGGCECESERGTSVAAAGRLLEGPRRGTSGHQPTAAAATPLQWTRFPIANTPRLFRRTMGAMRARTICRPDCKARRNGSQRGEGVRLLTSRCANTCPSLKPLYPSCIPQHVRIHTTTVSGCTPCFPCTSALVLESLIS